MNKKGIRLSLFYLAVKEKSKEDYMVRPNIVKDEHLTFLDSLRESGITNMFGARPYLIEEFGVSKSDASKVLSYWMDTFGKER